MVSAFIEVLLDDVLHQVEVVPGQVADGTWADRGEDVLQDGLAVDGLNVAFLLEQVVGPLWLQDCPYAFCNKNIELEESED